MSNTKSMNPGQKAPDIPSIAQFNVRAALAEDVGDGDVTAKLIPRGARATAWVTCREPAVICGQPWFDETFRQLDPAISVEWMVKEGDRVEPDTRICKITGPARAVLTGERTALNFLQTLSGTATAAAALAALVAGTGCSVLDTRKTIPGLRQAQKYAALCGGMRNHRIGLFDGILIKENHIMAAGGITAALQQARAIGRDEIFIQVEVETLEQLAEALDAEARMILLDNMDLTQMHQAVGLTAGRAELEASGNVSLETVRAIAETGVDRISVGSLTKNVRAIDLSLRHSED